jgi:hypothetical protein
MHVATHAHILRFLSLLFFGGGHDRGSGDLQPHMTLYSLRHVLDSSRTRVCDQLHVHANIARVHEMIAVHIQTKYETLGFLVPQTIQ